MSYTYSHAPHGFSDKRLRPTPPRMLTRLGSKVWIKRIGKRLSQRELAERAGISRKTVNAIESGKTLPSLPVAFKLAAALDITIEDLFSLM